MKQNYQLINRHDDIKYYVKDMKEEELSIGIMDTGSLSDLEQAIAWYRCNYNHSIYVITQNDRLDQTFISSLTDTSFILFDKSPTLAQRINALAQCCITTYFYVTRSDVDLVDLRWNSIKQLMEGEKHPAVLTPLIFNKNHELTPSVRAPMLQKDSVEPLSFLPSLGTDENLYPFLGLGIYNKALFQRLRGYDELISSAYWQVLDFGTRCWLYGYPIYSVNSLAIIFFSKQFLIEDRSEVEGCERFYSKALSITMNKGRVKFRKVSKGDSQVIKQEVKQKAGLYKTDFETLCQQWVINEED